MIAIGFPSLEKSSETVSPIISPAVVAILTWYRDVPSSNVLKSWKSFAILNSSRSSKSVAGVCETCKVQGVVTVGTFPVLVSENELARLTGPS